MSDLLLGQVSASRPTQFSRQVREHEVLRVAATLPAQDAAAASEAARKHVLMCAQKRSGGRLPANDWVGATSEYFFSERNTITVRLQGEQSDIPAIGTDYPDKTVPGRIWATEVTLARRARMCYADEVAELRISINYHWNIA